MNEAATSRLFAQVGARIAMLRRGHGLTQEALAERADLSPTYLARIEAGSREPTLRTLLSLADALGVAISLLFEDEREDLSSVLRLAVDGLAHEDVELIAALAIRLRTRPQARPRVQRGRAR